MAMSNTAIRNTAKALIVSNGKILVNRYMTQAGEIYYDLPGGGQHMLETMEEAVIREVLEETGYTARVVGFAPLAEEINERHPCIWDACAVKSGRYSFRCFLRAAMRNMERNSGGKWGKK